MTITLKPWMTVLLIGTICVLAGFAIGQVTSTQAAKDASASARALAVKDQAVISQLKKLNRSIGAPSSIGGAGTVIDELYDIRHNTGELCDEMASTVTCRR